MLNPVDSHLKSNLIGLFFHTLCWMGLGARSHMRPRTSMNSHTFAKCQMKWLHGHSSGISVANKQNTCGGELRAFNHDPEQECAPFFKRTKGVITLLIVEEIPDKEFAQKM